MKLIKKINTSAVLCSDNNGRQLVAFGKGLGFGEIGDDIEVGRVQRTFYNVSKRYIELINELPLEVVELSSRIVDVSSGLLRYEVSTNLPFILADHIAYALERTKKGVRVRMPLSYDVAQQYPVEYKIGEYALKLIRDTFGMVLPKDESAGIAMAFINNRIGAEADCEDSSVDCFDQILEECVGIIECDLSCTIRRESFNFARFATHLQYLFERLTTGQSLNSGNVELYNMARDRYPLISSCADRIRLVFKRELDTDLTDEETLYLMMHINRIVDREDPE